MLNDLAIAYQFGNSNNDCTKAEFVITNDKK